MTKHVPYFSSHSTIAVAVGFDRHTEALVKIAGGLAQKLGKRLALMHVVDAWASGVPAFSQTTPSPLWDAFPAVESSARSVAMERLSEIAQSLPKGLEVTSSVTVGPVAATLGTEAAGLGAMLLVVAVDGNAGRGPFAGLSTAVSLLAGSPIPVLAVDPGTHAPEVGTGMRILVADDLTDQAITAVEYAAALADGLGQAWVHHVHVSAFNQETLAVALKNVAASAHVALDGDESRAVFDAVHREQIAKLEARFSDDREYIEAGGGRYTSEVTAGGVRPELTNVVTSLAPDVIVFGRHRALHHQPFAFGRLPIRSMLAFKRPVLVVPSL